METVPVIYRKIGGVILMACLYIQVCAQSNLEDPLPNIHAVTIANDHPTLHATAIAQDQMGALWISAYDRGLYRYFGHDYDHLLSSPDLPDGLCGNDIYTMSFDLKDQLWISTNTHSGVCIYDYQRKTFSQPVLLDGQVFPNMVWFILHDSLGQTWMGTSDGVFVYSEENGLVNIDSVHTQVIFIEQQDSLIFAFEKNGCTVFDTKTQERIAGMWLGGYKVLVPFRPIAIGNAEFLLPWDNQIWKINVLSKESQVIYTTESPIYQFIKAPGFYYIVTQTGEVLQVDDLFNRSRPILKLDPANEITRYFSTAFNSDDHLIWFSWNSQLFQIEPSSGIHNILYPNGIAEKRSTSPVKVFDNQLVYLEGQQIRDLNSDKLIYTIPDQCLKHGKVVNYYFDATKKLWFHVTDNNKLDSWLYFTDGSILDSLPIRAFRTHFKEDDQSQLWICTDGQGIIRVHSDLRMESTNTSDGILKSDWVVDVEFVGDSTIAIGYRYDGLHLVNLSLDSTIENFEYNPEEIHTLSNNNIKKLELDSYGRLWIGTDAGLNYLDLHTRNMERFYYDSALPFPGLIYNLLEDDYQHLWVEMNNEIYFVNLENSLEAFKLPINLTPGEDIYHHAFLKANNSIYIPTDKFVKVIDSASLKQSQKVIPLQLVGYDLLNSDNRSENPSYAHNFVTKDSNHHITLPFRENSFTINYFIPDFTHRESNEYRYRIMGYLDNWVNVGNRQNISLYNMAAGQYHVELQGRNVVTGWGNPESVQVTILPPWYWSWWSITIYGLLLMSAIYWIDQFLLNRRLSKQKLIQAQELHEVKTNLYTNVTHEFRSPLTVILGLVDQLKRYIQHNDENKLDQSINLIRRNGERLLQLVNQLLDLNKMQSGDWVIKNTYGNIIYYLNYLIESYESLAEEKGIKIVIDQPDHVVMMDYDPDLIEKVISNLLTNAIKFSPENEMVEIKIDLTAEYLIIGIHNQGRDIPPEKVPAIFERFQQLEQSDQGTGIGLSLTKELLDKIGGQIEVQSGEGEGALFIIHLPIRHEAKNRLAMETPELNESFEGEHFFTDEKPVVLVVEDNLEVAYYIGECLEEDYNVIYSRDGQKGMEKALDLIPDFIISDVMMPVMDGVTMTKTLKNDIRCSHIPVILLTAKTEDQAKLEGLQAGADAYLTKPFDKKELLIRMQQLLLLRKNLIAKYGNLDNLNRDRDDEKENQFLTKFKIVIERDITQDFTVQELCREMSMSRTQLHRKIKALTNQSTSQYVRSIRINKAKELLVSTELTVSEIAYEVGFQSPSYFTRMFTQVAGMTPTEWRGDKQ